jgi:hypothetical protein
MDDRKRLPSNINRKGPRLARRAADWFYCLSRQKGSLMPLELNDAEMSLLTELAAPIQQSLRPEFLRAVATELEAQRSSGAIGEGAIHRIARTVQRQFWTPPQLARNS